MAAHRVARMNRAAAAGAPLPARRRGRIPAAEMSILDTAACAPSGIAAQRAAAVSPRGPAAPGCEGVAARRHRAPQAAAAACAGVRLPSVVLRLALPVPAAVMRRARPAPLPAGL